MPQIRGIGSPRTLEREKAHPWFGQPFDEAAILLDQVVEVLAPPQFTRFGDASFHFELAEGFGIRSVFVHVDHPWLRGMRGSKGFHKEALGCFCISGWAQHEVERVPDAESTAR